MHLTFTKVRAFIILVAFALASIARGDLFVSSFTQNSVRRYDENTGAFIGTFISAGLGGLNAPHRGAFGPDGNFYVASANNDRVLRYNGATGAFIDVFASAAQLDYPVDLQWGPDGNLYVSSQLSDSVVRFNGTTGAFIDVFVSAGSGGLDGPSGIQFHGGDLFVAGRFNTASQNHVYRYDGLTGGFELGFGMSEINTGFGLDFGVDGNLYVVSGGSNVVVKFDPLSGASLGNFVTSGSGGLNGAIGVEFGPDGNLYVASLNTDIIERYNGMTGAPLSDFVSAGSGGLDAPNFFTFAVPEPTSAALLFIGAALPLLRRRAPKTVVVLESDCFYTALGERLFFGIARFDSRQTVQPVVVGARAELTQRNTAWGNWLRASVARKRLFLIKPGNG